MKEKYCFKKCLSAFLLIAVMLSALGINTSAAAYESYTYDAWDEEIVAPVGYTVKDVILGTDLGIGKMVEPSDVFVDKNNTVYISDSGNNRVLKISDNLSAVSVIDSVVIDGNTEKLETPSALFVDGAGNLFICQKEKGRVIEMAPDGNVREVYTRPESTLLDEDFKFLPSSVIKSSNGTVYILSEGYYYGALAYDSKGEFAGFFGSNKVDITVQVLADYAWKKIMSEEQKNKMTRYVPIAYVSMDIDDDNFIYTCTQITKDSKDELRKLNATGSDVITLYNKNISGTAGNYGDLKSAFLNNTSIVTQFVDICVDRNGLINGLDRTRGRVFQYNTEGRLISIFGGSGTKDGTFANAVAVDEMGDMFVVLDKEKASLTVFEPTDYTKTLHKALGYYEDGLYDEARPLWEELISKNVNCEVAYMGLGRALYSAGEYKDAMKMCKRGYDREGYSLAFKAQRDIFLRRTFPIVASILMIIIALIVIYIIIRVAVLKKPFVKKEKPLTPLGRIKRSLTHPMDEFYDLKDTNTWSMPAAIVILLSWFALTTMSKNMTGFIFNYHRSEKTNVLYYFAGTVILYCLFVVINWGVTTLTDGKGNMYQIFVAGTYALIPYIATIAINILMSNIFTADEAAFYSFIQVVGILWSVFIMVGALRSIHDFTFTKTIVCGILTLLGIFFVLFLLVLFVSLAQQFFSFVTSVFNELLFRS